MNNIPRSAGWLLAGALLLLSAGTRAADDKAALGDLKEVKVAFDLKEGDPKALLNRLNIIDETRLSLIRQGVKPHFILAFRGPATRLLQTDQSLIKPEAREMATQVVARIHQMHSSEGVEGFEQCAVAVREQGTKVENVIPEVHVVGNGFISLMAYQARGYAYIAP